jgi:hypothetical protein
MKLRIKGNSVRLRITPSEMTRLLATGRIDETIYFSSDENTHLTYALEHASEASKLHVRYSPQEIAVVVSSAEARRWAGGADVGMYGEISTAHGPLELAIEKDFACLDKGPSENIDTFPHPHEGAPCE